MINKLEKKEKNILIGVFILLLIIHFPLMIKNIISADILLNNSYYSGYSWELSLGRFGLFIIGLLKSYLSIPHIDLILSYLLISVSTYYLFKLFDIKETIPIVLTILFITINPITSSILLFHYCSVGYLLAFFLSILSIYCYYHIENKYLKYIFPIICMVISLSMYQAYLSCITTLWLIYHIHLLLKKELKIKDALIYLLLILGSIIIYFIGMKLSQIIFHIDMSYYSNADSIGLSTLLLIPQKIINSYQLFYEFYFTDIMMKTKVFHNNIINLFILIGFVGLIIKKAYQQKIEKKEWIILILSILLLPVFMNSIIFVISESKLQLLMSTSYLLLPIYLFSLITKKEERMICCILFGLLIRNYYIQIQATYLTLENTFNTYHTVVEAAINQNSNKLNKEFAIIGTIPEKDSIYEEISKLNYGYISDEDLFWDEHYNKKIAFERFTRQYFGLNLTFTDEDKYNEIIKYPSNKLIYEKNNVIVINMNELKKEN